MRENNLNGSQHLITLERFKISDLYFWGYVSYYMIFKIGQDFWETQFMNLITLDDTLFNNLQHRYLNSTSVIAKTGFVFSILLCGVQLWTCTKSACTFEQIRWNYKQVRRLR